MVCRATVAVFIDLCVCVCVCAVITIITCTNKSNISCFFLLDSNEDAYCCCCCCCVVEVGYSLLVRLKQGYDYFLVGFLYLQQNIYNQVLAGLVY